MRPSSLVVSAVYSKAVYFGLFAVMPALCFLRSDCRNGLLFGVFVALNEYFSNTPT